METKKNNMAFPKRNLWCIAWEPRAFLNLLLLWNKLTEIIIFHARNHRLLQDQKLWTKFISFYWNACLLTNPFFRAPVYNCVYKKYQITPKNVPGWARNFSPETFFCCCLKFKPDDKTLQTCILSPLVFFGFVAFSIFQHPQHINYKNNGFVVAVGLRGDPLTICMANGVLKKKGIIYLYFFACQLQWTKGNAVFVLKFLID